MMYIHYCPKCKKIFTLNGHKTLCPKCNTPMKELDITYLKYLALSPEERNSYTELHIIKENTCQDT